MSGYVGYVCICRLCLSKISKPVCPKIWSSALLFFLWILCNIYFTPSFMLTPLYFCNTLKFHIRTHYIYIITNTASSSLFPTSSPFWFFKIFQIVIGTRIHISTYAYRNYWVLLELLHAHVLMAVYLELENLSGDWRNLILLLSKHCLPVVLYLEAEPCGFFSDPSFAMSACIFII